jgi:hypothetical protein
MRIITDFSLDAVDYNDYQDTHIDISLLLHDSIIQDDDHHNVPTTTTSLVTARRLRHPPEHPISDRGILIFDGSVRVIAQPTYHLLDILIFRAAASLNVLNLWNLCLLIHLLQTFFVILLEQKSGKLSLQGSSNVDSAVQSLVRTPNPVVPLSSSS